jgi:hypothetical protein
MTAPKEVFGKWSTAHTLWVPRSSDVNIMGGEQKKIELCEQATFLSENELLKENC